jgi:asparagine synthase (glutamine-hydrolysing)
LAFLPTRLRRAVADRGGAAELSWLSPEARSALEAALAAEHAGEPIRWRQRVDWLARRRGLSTQRASGEALAAAAGAALVEPFLDPAFLASLEQYGGRRGYGTRDAAMETLFAGLVPAAVRSRPSKARFNRALWGEDARAFASEWDGDAPFGELVDADELRRTWLLDAPDYRSATALQAVWLTHSRATLAAAGAKRGDPWGEDDD